MPFSKIKEFEKSFPQVKDMENKRKVMDIFNAIMEDDPDMDEGKAIATAISQVQDEEMADIDRIPPKTAQNNAQKVLRWREEHPDEINGMTDVGWRRAKQLSKGKELSKDIIKRMAQFNRHRENAKVDEEHKGKPWKDAGRVAWLGWGGNAGIDWALKQSKKLKQENMQEDFKYISQLSEKDISQVEVLRVGKVHDRGLEITDEMLEGFVNNFEDNVYGNADEDGNPLLAVNANHERGAEALGWVKDLSKEGDTLMATVEWTDKGKEKIDKDLFKFVSAEFNKKYPHHKTGDLVENVFTGLALTNTPALKGQKPIQLSEQLTNLLKDKIMFNKVLEKLKEREVVSKEDKEMLNELFQELDEEEQEDVEDDVEEVKNKPEEEDEEEEGEEEDKEDKKEEDDEELSEKETVSMEEYNETKQELSEMREKLETKELNETFEKELMVSKDSPVGFQEKDQDKVVEFMSNLTPDQRNEFQELLSSVSAVDIEVKGSDESVNLSGDKTDKIVELTEEILEENPELDPAAAQKKAVKRLES